MIQREELEQILNFVASRWSKTVQEPDNKAMENLPNDFWMNSIGGKTAKGGHWITTMAPSLRKHSGVRTNWCITCIAEYLRSTRTLPLPSDVLIRTLTAV